MIPIIPTMDHTQLAQVTRMFAAIRQACGDLTHYYSNLQPRSYNVNVSAEIYFPFPTTVNNISFKYTSYLKQLVLTAETITGSQKFIVKFVQQYNSKAHMLCAEAGGSPALLGIEDNVIFGWKMVVMEAVEGNILIPNITV